MNKDSLVGIALIMGTVLCTFMFVGAFVYQHSVDGILMWFDGAVACAIGSYLWYCVEDDDYVDEEEF